MRVAPRVAPSTPAHDDPAASQPGGPRRALRLPGPASLRAGRQIAEEQKPGLIDRLLGRRHEPPVDVQRAAARVAGARIETLLADLNREVGADPRSREALGALRADLSELPELEGKELEEAVRGHYFELMRIAFAHEYARKLEGARAEEPDGAAGQYYEKLTEGLRDDGGREWVARACLTNLMVETDDTSAPSFLRRHARKWIRLAATAGVAMTVVDHLTVGPFSHPAWSSARDALDGATHDLGYWGLLAASGAGASALEGRRNDLDEDGIDHSVDGLMGLVVEDWFYWISEDVGLHLAESPRDAAWVAELVESAVNPFHRFPVGNWWQYKFWMDDVPLLSGRFHFGEPLSKALGLPEWAGLGTPLGAPISYWIAGAAFAGHLYVSYKRHELRDWESAFRRLVDPSRANAGRALERLEQRWPEWRRDLVLHSTRKGGLFGRRRPSFSQVVQRAKDLEGPEGERLIREALEAQKDAGKERKRLAYTDATLKPIGSFFDELGLIGNNSRRAHNVVKGFVDLGWDRSAEQVQLVPKLRNLFMAGPRPAIPRLRVRDDAGDLLDLDPPDFTGKSRLLDRRSASEVASDLLHPLNVFWSMGADRHLQWYEGDEPDPGAAFATTFEWVGRLADGTDRDRLLDLSRRWKSLREKTRDADAPEALRSIEGEWAEYMSELRGFALELGMGRESFGRFVLSYREQFDSKHRAASLRKQIVAAIGAEDPQGSE